jgi:hypothetical protein
MRGVWCVCLLCPSLSSRLPSLSFLTIIHHPRTAIELLGDNIRTGLQNRNAFADPTEAAITHTYAVRGLKARYGFLPAISPFVGVCIGARVVLVFLFVHVRCGARGMLVFRSVRARSVCTCVALVFRFPACTHARTYAYTHRHTRSGAEREKLWTKAPDPEDMRLLTRPYDLYDWELGEGRKEMEAAIAMEKEIAKKLAAAQDKQQAPAPTAQKRGARKSTTQAAKRTRKQ